MGFRNITRLNYLKLLQCRTYSYVRIISLIQNQRKLDEKASVHHNAFY